MGKIFGKVANQVKLAIRWEKIGKAGKSGEISHYKSF